MLKEELRNSLRKRFLSKQLGDEQNIKFIKPYVLSTLLDPRFKGRYMQDEPFTEGKSMLLQELKRVSKKQLENENTGNQQGKSIFEDEPLGKKRKRTVCRRTLTLTSHLAMRKYLMRKKVAPILKKVKERHKGTLFHSQFW